MRRREQWPATPGPAVADAEHEPCTPVSPSLKEMASSVERLARGASADSFHHQRLSIAVHEDSACWEPIVMTPAISNHHSIHVSNSTTSIRPSSSRPLDDFSLRYHATIVVKESISLLHFLVHGTSAWFAKFLGLMLFVVALTPAFVVFVGFYFITSDRIALPYIDDNTRTSRHYLDIYGGANTSTREEGKPPLKPVVFFLTGGAWIIGYKMWGTLLARTLAPFGILVVIPDYRNFPQTNIEGMIQDVDRAVDWTLKNINKYGGDPTKIVICGQSAGAHIGACLLLQKAAQMEQLPKPTTSWRAADIRGFIAVSGPHDLVALKDILHQHGLDKSIVAAMFTNDLSKYSPALIVRELAENNTTPTAMKLRQQFPPTCIIHGECDKTVPFEISLELYRAMKQLEMSVQFKLYPSWSHTDPILEAPFAGNHLFHRDVYDLVKLWTTVDGGTDGNDEGGSLVPFDESHPACAKICPLFLVQIARVCNPF